MNRLSLSRRTQIINCLVEGNSIRSTERMTDTHRDTVMRLLVEVGDGCAKLIDLAVDAATGGVVAAGYRAHALGATPVSELRGADSAPWQVWRDPDGNEFCLVTEAADTSDARPGSSGVSDAQSAGAR